MALHAQVFNRPPTVAAAERRRWRAAFGKAGLQHYLYEREGVVTGICELCVDDSVAGLYSVGFLEAARSLYMLRHAVQMARDAVREQGLRLMYFERARKASQTSDATRATRRIVRVFDAWARIS
jgi:ethanolamine ammonia-lyase large subunit